MPAREPTALGGASGGGIAGNSGGGNLRNKLRGFGNRNLGGEGDRRREGYRSGGWGRAGRGHMDRGYSHRR